MIGELVVAGAWTSFGIAVLVFGFLPGFALRLIVRMLPKDDERRMELVSELYEYKRLERPFWVAEQLETCLFEGIAERRKLRHQVKLRDQSGLDWVPITILVSGAAPGVRDTLPSQYTVPIPAYLLDRDQSEVFSHIKKRLEHQGVSTSEIAHALATGVLVRPADSRVELERRVP